MCWPLPVSWSRPCWLNPGRPPWRRDARRPGLHLGFDTADARVQGNGWLVPGVAGQALQLDGIAAHVVVPAADVPPLAGSFTVEGWVALGAYPFNDAPLLQQQDGESVGFFLGVGDRGQVRFDVAAGGRRLSLASAEHLPLRQWAHVAGVFEEGKGATLYVNGQPAGVAGGTGPFVQATRSDLWIGRNAYEMEQSAPVGHGRQQPTRILLDGVLDELRITPGARSAADIAAAHARTKAGRRSSARGARAPDAALGPGRVRRLLHAAALLQGLGRRAGASETRPTWSCASTRRPTGSPSGGARATSRTG